MINSSGANRLSLALLVGFFLLGINLIVMQGIRVDYYRSLSEKNRIRVLYLEAARGKILDRNGQALATSRLSFNCSAIPGEAHWKIKDSCEILGPLIGEKPKDLEQRFYHGKAGAFRTVLIAEDVTLTQAIAIEERLDLLPGFLIETHPQREYPLGESAAHLIGFIGPITDQEEESAEFYGYRDADWVGREGIEKSYEGYLRGFSGGLQIEVNSRGRMVKALGVREPKEGKDLELTVDARLQSVVQNLLRLQKGAVLVMDLKDGGLLSMNSSPSFDSNFFASRNGRREVGRYLHGENSPMVNRGIRGQYPPGSIFKIVTALAALESHKIKSSTAFLCSGSWLIGGNSFHCWKEVGHGIQKLADAFAHSCNVYFYHAGLTAGVDAIIQKSLEMGFARETGVDLPGEKKGFIPSKGWKRKRYHESWYDGETANLAIGQGYLQITPIQALMMIARVATGGQSFRPHLIDKIDGVKVVEKPIKSLVRDANNWQAIQDGLDQVVSAETGTGRLARVPGVRVAGKTGTAQSGQKNTHAWFVGYAPQEHPKIAIVVFLEHGGRGGIQAATLASTVIEWLKGASYL